MGLDRQSNCSSPLLCLKQAYMLTPQQLGEFGSQGFLKLPSVVPADLLASLDLLFDQLLVVEEGIGKTITCSGNGEFVTNVDTLCDRGNLACLELFGLPAILEMAWQICGDDFFPIQEWAVIKHLGDELPVLWHQDMVHRRTGRCFTMGIYLDRADEGDGALRVIPGSHESGRDICSLKDDPFIEIPMAAGDILIHDMMLAHCSEPLTRNQQRRVIYVEFLSAAHVAREAIYAPDLVARRTRLKYAASRLFAMRNPEQRAFDQLTADPEPLDDLSDIRRALAEIYSAPINARPSSYCINGVSVFSSL